jgi:TPR repeat protein
MKKLRFLMAAAVVLVGALGVSAQDSGDWSGQVSKAVALITGDGVKKDVRAGFDLLQTAAAAGDALALRLLGDIYSSGRLVRKDEPLALQLYHKAAAAGEPDALSEIGMRHTLGWGLPKDDAEGVRYAMKAAAAGNIAATMYLASRYESGQGVEKNPATAVQLFRQAAEAGSAHAMCYLADMYAGGLGSARNPAEAYRWYSAALAATPKVRPIRPVDFITLHGRERKLCESRRKEAGKTLSGDARAAAEVAARQWLATIRYPVIP